jgi:hypothetical protein
MGMPCRDVLLELLHERQSLFELGPVSYPVSQSEPVSEPGPVSEPAPVSDPESVPESVPQSLSEPELALVMALEQLWLHVLLQLQLWRCELLPRVGPVASCCEHRGRRQSSAMRITSGPAADLGAPPPEPVVYEIAMPWRGNSTHACNTPPRPSLQVFPYSHLLDSRVQPRETVGDDRGTAMRP